MNSVYLYLLNFIVSLTLISDRKFNGFEIDVFKTGIPEVLFDFASLHIHHVL